MLLSQPQDQSREQDRGRPLLHRSRLLTGAGLLSLAAIALLTGAAEPGQQGNPDRPYLIPEANPLPDVNDRMKMREQQAKQQNFDAANAERKKQLSDDSTTLLTLAMALTAEGDKTNKEMLSLNVIRKADEIEKLAHDVKEKMKLTIGGS